MGDNRDLARLNRPLTWAAGSLARWNPPGSDAEYSGELRRVGQQDKQEVEAAGLTYAPPRENPDDRARRLSRWLPATLRSRETEARLSEALQDNPDWDRWDVQRWGRQQAEKPE